MNRKLRVIMMLMCLAVVLVNSQPSDRVGKNGAKQNAKRINESHLNEGRAMSIMPRRKRVTLPQPLYYDEQTSVENEDKDSIKDTEQQAILFYAPPILDDEKENEEIGMEMIEDEEKSDGNGEEVINNLKEIKQEKSEENEKITEETLNKDENEAADDGTIEVIQFSNLSQLLSDDESVADTDPEFDVVQLDNDNIIALYSHIPPKVNSETHAVFKLVPVNYDGVVEDKGDETKDTAGDYDLEEEFEPITTTAIWSTGDDSSKDSYDDLKPIKDQKVVRKTTRRPPKANKKKYQRRNKYTGNYRRGLRKEEKNKRRRTKTGNRRPIRRHESRPGNSSRRRSPQKHIYNQEKN